MGNDVHDNHDLTGVALVYAGRRLCAFYRIGMLPILSIIAAMLLLSSCVNPLLKLTSASVTPPSVSPAGGVYGTDQTVTLSGAVSGATIYYTVTNGPAGTAPTMSSAKYTGAIPVAGNGTNETVEAIAVSGGKSSGVVQATYVINYSIGGTPALASPSFSPGAGVYMAAPTGGVGLSGPSGASIYYTTNGTTPTASSGTLYTGPIPIANTDGSTTTVRAVTVESGYVSSPVVSASYEINYSQVSTPSFSPTPGLNLNNQTGITITVPSPPSGTTIYYTATPGYVGTTPTTSSNVYSSTTPISVTGSGTVETLEAMATAPGYTQSTVTVATFAISVPTVPFTSSGTLTVPYGATQLVVKLWGGGGAAGWNGGGGGGNYGATIANGNGRTPGNAGDPVLPAGDAVGGGPTSGCGTASGPGYVYIQVN